MGDVRHVTLGQSTHLAGWSSLPRRDSSGWLALMDMQGKLCSSDAGQLRLSVTYRRVLYDAPLCRQLSTEISRRTAIDEKTCLEDTKWPKLNTHILG